MDTSSKLRFLREQKRLSQEECAKALHIDRTTYAKYENGGSIKRIAGQLAKFFNVTTDYLLGLSDTPHGVASGEPDISAAEKALLEAYRKASDRDKDIIDTILKPSVRPKKEEVS